MAELSLKRKWYAYGGRCDLTWPNLDTWMNGWFQPQRFTRTLFTTDIFGSCSRNALEWKHRVGREQAISRALFRTVWLSAVISPSIYPACALPLWTVELHYDTRLPRFRSGLQRRIALFTVSHCKRVITHLPTAGRVNIYYRTVLLSPLSNNQTNNLR